MPLEPTQNPAFRFSIRDMLFTFAGLGAVLGGIITLVKLDDASTTWTALSSEIQVVDGVPNAVPVRIQVSEESGRLVTPGYVRSLWAALFLEVVVIVLVLAYASRRRQASLRIRKK